MATVNRFKTFTSGQTVVPNDLHQLVDSATVTNIVDADIGSGAAIALSKLATGALPAAITVASANLVDGTIATADIADAAVTAAKLNGAQTGSAPIYGCRAWVNFDGSRDASGAASTANTTRFIRQNGNVASVLRIGQGEYTVTFTEAMQDANYAAQCAIKAVDNATRHFDWVSVRPESGSVVRIFCTNPSFSGLDPAIIMLAIFR